jgi:hypothetical protein
VRSARFAHVVAAAGAALVLICWQCRLASASGTLFGDFRAFYCAGAAVAHGANPYTAGALYACEHAPQPFGLYHAVAGVAVPAPLPGYALLPFTLLAQLPYAAACAIWAIVLLASVLLSIRVLALLLDRRMDATAWALVPGFAIVVLPFGELGSIEIAAVLCMARFLRLGAYSAATIAGAFAMILPQIGLPALLAAFIFIPAMRVRIVAAAAVLVLLDIAGSAGAAFSYLASVLPAHARAEISSSVQYGITWMVHAANGSDAAAIAAGGASYALMLVLGIAASRRVQARTHDDAWYALLPPAFAVFGGSFSHYAQIMVAIPAALLLASGVTESRRALFACAALLLVVPWLWVLAQPLLLAAFAVVCAMCAATLLDYAADGAMRAAFGAVLLGGAIMLAGAHFGAGSRSAFHLSAANTALAQDAWARYMNARHAGTGPVWWIAKAPTWLGLLLVVLLPNKRSAVGRFSLV